MGYSRNPNLPRWLEAKLEDLRDGEEFTLQDDPSSIGTLRNQIYAWMHQNGVKPIFKISQINLDLIRISRKRFPSPRIVTNQPDDPRIISLVTSKLINIKDEDKALEIIRANLPKELWEKTINEWREKCK